MPKAPPHACHVPTCGLLLPRGEECPEHGARKRHDRERGSAHKRGYGRRWRRGPRAAKLAVDPLCERCLPSIVEAEQVHHKDGDASNNVMANLESLCTACHSRETRARQGA